MFRIYLNLKTFTSNVNKSTHIVTLAECKYFYLMTKNVKSK